MLTFKERLNAVFPDIQFTMEEEENNQLAFLDVLDVAIETVQLLLRNKYDKTENRLGQAQVLQLLKFCLRTYFKLDGTIYEHVKGTPMGSLISGFIAEAVLQRLTHVLGDKYDETENRLGLAQIIQSQQFCLKTYFTFNGTINEKVSGTSMGSPISGLIADGVLKRLESLAFRKHRLKSQARYVDDRFEAHERDQVRTFKECLNAVFRDIQFTMEDEENSLLAVSDVLACRKDCHGPKSNVFR
nr:unnamed protein product [Spirometra erinaceieuropaei]